MENGKRYLVNIIKKRSTFSSKSEKRSKVSSKSETCLQGSSMNGKCFKVSCKTGNVPRFLKMRKKTSNSF